MNLSQRDINFLRALAIDPQESEAAAPVQGSGELKPGDRAVYMKEGAFYQNQTDWASMLARWALRTDEWERRYRNMAAFCGVLLAVITALMAWILAGW